MTLSIVTGGQAKICGVGRGSVQVHVQVQV
ncbi:MAG: hypothetical protein H6Q06_1050 [Acidobacteria bacterium]|nr:hypothetical protein [Acidobacteriota bacterium]